MWLWWAAISGVGVGVCGAQHAFSFEARGLCSTPKTPSPWRISCAGSCRAQAPCCQFSVFTSNQSCVASCVLVS